MKPELGELVFAAPFNAGAFNKEDRLMKLLWTLQGFKNDGNPEAAVVLERILEHARKVSGPLRHRIESEYHEGGKRVLLADYVLLKYSQ